MPDGRRQIIGWTIAIRTTAGAGGFLLVVVLFLWLSHTLWPLWFSNRIPPEGTWYARYARQGFDQRTEVVDHILVLNNDGRFYSLMLRDNDITGMVDTGVWRMHEGWLQFSQGTSYGTGHWASKYIVVKAGRAELVVKTTDGIEIAFTPHQGQRSDDLELYRGVPW